MPKIVALDQNMINMIAAGEVIERPANVVKELLENSIDAQAEKIIVQIEDGGKKLISVTDDGAGMDADDLAMAFHPHATSKIKSQKDLLAIQTMGFRGEALASIAAVSKVIATSRPTQSLQAHRLEIDCGKTEKITAASSDCGTTIEVRNLFYKLPARRKFLRTANTEMTHISEHFTRIALANPSLDMTLIHNRRQINRLTTPASIPERIAQLFSPDIAQDLMETGTEEKNIKIFALLGKPERARASAKFQYVFLNNRYIRDKFIGHAVKEAYRGFIEPNKFPIVFLFLEVPLESYDVNVHPTKIEVRFENANLIHSQVLGAIREKLLSTNLDVTAQLPPLKAQLSEDTPLTAQDHARRQRITEATR